MSTAPINHHDQSKRNTTARSFRIAMALAIAATAAATFVVASKQQRAVARLEDRVGLLVRETDGLKSREGHAAADPSVDTRLAQLDSNFAKLATVTDALQAAQSDTSQELGHVRAEIANASIGIEELRSSIDDHDTEQRKAITDVNGRVDLLKQLAAPSDVTATIPVKPVRRRARMSASHWSVQDARDGGAVIAGSNGTVRVMPGTEVPGLGLVTGVHQRANRWIVTTSNGVVVQR